MPNSMHSSSGSASCRPADASCRPADASCRIEWRPSRWLLAALLALAALAAFSILTSEMPRIAAWPLAFAALGYGAARFLHERSRPPRRFLLRGADSPVLVDGVPVAGFDLQWRGPLAFAAWRDANGRHQRAAWWPDTLPAPRRRELRLAAPTPAAARRRSSMAP